MTSTSNDQSQRQQRIVVVTPVYRDTDRLAAFGPSLARTFAGSRLPIRWVIADDGSGDAESARVRALADLFREVFPYIEVFEKGEHLGKGGTVRSAWEAYSEASWLGFLDADGSVGAESLLNLIHRALEAGPGHAVVASRRKDRATTVVQKPFRKLTHRTFATFARNLLSLPVHDVQCGAKIVEGTAFRSIAPLLRENGFAFDGELLLALHRHGVDLIEIPVDWAEKSGGSVRPFAVILPMARAILRVRKRARRGCYDPAEPKNE